MIWRSSLRQLGSCHLVPGNPKQGAAAGCHADSWYTCNWCRRQESRAHRSSTSYSTPPEQYSSRKCRCVSAGVSGAAADRASGRLDFTQAPPGQSWYSWKEVERCSDSRHARTQQGALGSPNCCCGCCCCLRTCLEGGVQLGEVGVVHRAQDGLLGAHAAHLGRAGRAGQAGVLG